MDPALESLVAAAEVALAGEEFAAALRAASAALAALDPAGPADERVRALLVVGAAAPHAGDPERGGRAFDEALAAAGPALLPAVRLAAAAGRLRQGRCEEARDLLAAVGEPSDARSADVAAELRRRVSACSMAAPRWLDAAGAPVRLDAGLERIDAGTARGLVRVAVLDRPARDAAFSASGGRLAVGTSTGAAVFRADTLACERVIASDRLELVTLLRGGTRLLGRSDGFLTVWDADSGAFLREPAENHRFHGRVARHPDDDLLAVASALGVWLLRADAPDPPRALAPGAGDEAVAFVDGGATLVAVDWGGPLRRWRVADGARLDDLPLPARTRRFAAAASGELCVEDGRQVRVLGPGGVLQRTIDVRTRHLEDVWGLAASPDGSLLVTTSLYGPAHAWDLRTGRHLAALPITDAPRDLEVSPDGRWLLARPGTAADRPAVLYGVRRG